MIKQWDVPFEDRDLVALLMARFAFAIDPELVEWEIFDVIQEFLEAGKVDYASMDILAGLLRATKFDPETDLWN